MTPDLGLGARSIIDLIGNTPIVQIRTGNDNVKILIKLEGMNPSGSIKDVAAHYMILDAEKKGLLKKGDTILEATSGNTGIAIAMIAAAKGYKTKLVMSAGVSDERKKILKAYGAEIILTDKNKGTDGAIIKARQMKKDNPKLIYLDQFSNKANWLGHYHITGNEIWRQTNGNVTHVVAGMGTGGTLMGVSKRLKEFDPEVRVIGVEPVKGHKIQGLKNMSEAIKPPIYDESLIDEKVLVNDEQAFKAARWLAREQGILGGMSTGAAMHAALKLAEKLDYGVIVVISPDNGFKYLSTDLFN